MRAKRASPHPLRLRSSHSPRAATSPRMFLRPPVAGRSAPAPAPGPSSQRAAALVARAGRTRRGFGGGAPSGARRERPASSPSPSDTLREGGSSSTRTSLSPVAASPAVEEGGAGGVSAASTVEAPPTPSPSPPPTPNKRGASADDRHADGRSGDETAFPRPPGGRLARPGKAELFLYRTDGLSCSRELVKRTFFLAEKSLGRGRTDFAIFLSPHQKSHPLSPSPSHKQPAAR